MRSRHLPALLLLLALAAPAAANGRFPASMSVTPLGPGRGILLGTTFGVVYSADDGASWRWECEAAAGYSGAFDPTFAVTPAGTILAGTDYGLSITRDGGCSWTFADAPLIAHWINDVRVGPDGAVWLATSTSGKPNDVFVSRDDAASFTPTHVPETAVFWGSVRVAPSDPSRVYVAGYHVETTGDAGSRSVPVVYRTDDAAGRWTALPVKFPSPSTTRIALLAVSPTDPDVVFAKSFDPSSLLRSPDGGMTWATVFEAPGKIDAFVIEADGAHAVVGSDTPFAYTSDDGGRTFVPASQQVRLACLAVHPDGSLYGCGSNFGPEKLALGRSTDHGQTWSKVFSFADMKGPLACSAGSVQKDTCEPQWPTVAAQFGLPGSETPDAAPTTPPKKNGGGGCGCGVSAALLGLIWVSRAKRRQS